MFSSVSDLHYGAGANKYHLAWSTLVQFFWCASLCSVCIICLGLPTRVLSQDTVKLIAKPDSCVALHRGQQCFTRVQLFWSDPADSEVCVFTNTDNKPLFCLSGNTRKASVAYASDTSTLYSLRSKSTKRVLAEVVVRTAWVYRTGRKSSSGWRLF